jgi:ATP-dependent DNA ligase
VLPGDRRIPIQFMVFDVLFAKGESLISRPYSVRRQLLETLRLNGASWWTPQAFQDGEGLFAAVRENGLEGIVAKPLRSLYRPGKRGWIKIKNRAYRRRPSEIEAMYSSLFAKRRSRQPLGRTHLN